jgi:hypothetical protein
LEETTITVSAQFQYEYFLFNAPQPLLKSRAFIMFGKLYTINGQPVIGQRVVAEDSEVTIYESQIFQRKTPYVNVGAINIG